MSEQWDVQVRSSSIHAQGCFATRDFMKGELIIEYIGERIDEETAGMRYDDDNMERHHTFLFGTADGSYLDAAVGGNEARYINHSCNPNCDAKEDNGRIFVYAKRDIRSGDELTYDYRLERDGKPKKAWLRLYACHCGAKNCRGTMLRPVKGIREMIAEQKKKLKEKARAAKAKAAKAEKAAKAKAKSKARAKSASKKK